MMRIAAILLCLALASSSAPSDWTASKEIASNILPTSLGSPSVLSDPTTYVTHVFYCGSNKGLHYLQISPKDQPSEPRNLHPDANCNAISVASSADGKSVYVAEGVTNGLLEDVFFLESKDAGLTWSVPVVMPREDPKDILVRSAPSIVAAPSGRLWVFYTRQTNASNRKAVVATRAPGSEIFASEVLVDLNANLPYLLRATFSSHDGQDYLHLVWNDLAFTSKSSVKHSVSMDNGVTWTEPKVLASKARCSSVLVDGAEVSVMSGEVGGQHTIRSSNDDGQSWTDDLAVIDFTAKPVSSQCKVAAKHFAIVEDIIEPTKFGLYDAQHSKFSPLQTAFKDLKEANVPALACYYDPAAKATVVRAFATSGLSSLYTTTSLNN